MTTSPTTLRTWVLALAGLLITPAVLPAQGLIWSLPEQEGTWVRYEGEYKQTEFRPGVATGDQIFNWRRNVTIKSLVFSDDPRSGQRLDHEHGHDYDHSHD